MGYISAPLETLWANPLISRLDEKIASRDLRKPINDAILNVKNSIKKPVSNVTY